MATFNSKNLSVITVPLKMKRQIQQAKDIKKKNNKSIVLRESRKGQLSTPIITCKDPKLNFYKGQSYGKFENVPLASRGWRSRKSKGDFFTIHKSGQNPAFMELDCVPAQFEDMGLDPRIVKQLKENGFERPTNIQSLAIPHILRGSNTVVAAETGNGKSLAFLAPIIHQVLMRKKQCFHEGSLNSPKALILVPGRELALQTRDMARAIASDLGVNVNSVIGGRTKKQMLYPRMHPRDIIVSSFGALSKLVTAGIYKLDEVEHLVLDEADTLLDDSFNDSLCHFLKKLAIRDSKDGVVDPSSGVQLSFVGATFPRSIPSILDKIVEMDSLVHVQTPHLHRLSPHIKQTFMRVGHDERSERLLKIARRNHKDRIPTIIFSNNSSCSDWVALFLEDNGIPCANINGEMNAALRIGKFDTFQSEKCGILSCTDLVSRGLDTIRAKHILNFDFPRFISDYIHRCGRTGRVGTEGDSNVTSFVYRGIDVELVNKIEYACRKLESLPNVNANITRIINARRAKYEDSQLEVPTSE